MRTYENILFSFYCDDVFLKKGLFEILEQAQNEESGGLYNGCTQKIINKCSIKDDYYWIDIVALSSKSIFQKIPQRNRLFEDEKNGVMVFCTKKIMHLIKGMSGYENAVFIAVDAKIVEVKNIFKDILSGRKIKLNGMSSRLNLDTLPDRATLDKLTARERLVSELFKIGKTQQEISKLTKLNVKTVSSHLRSAMSKYHVNSLLEYRVKLSNIQEIKYAQ